MSLFSKFVPFKEQLERYVERSRQIFEEVGDKASARLVDGFVRDLDRQRYNLTIVGSFNRGKSTLLNVLMERGDDDISPVACTACTSAIIKYLDKDLIADAEGEGAIVYYNLLGREPERIPLPRIRDFVTEERNPKNEKGVRSIEVYGNFPTWSRAITIVDTPGQNTVYAHHDALLSDFLPYTDAIIFLVAADLPFDGGDIALLKELSEKQKREVFFVLSKMDEIRPGDRAETIEYVSRIISKNGFDPSRLYCVSAKPVFEALKNGIGGEALANLKSENGIGKLEADLERFVVLNSDVTKVMKSRIATLLNSVKEAGERYVHDTEAILESKDLDLAELKAQESTLDADSNRLREGLAEKLEEFQRNWVRTLRKCGRKIEEKADRIEFGVNEQIGRNGVSGTLFQTFALKQLIAETVNRELQPVFNDVQAELEDVVQKLDKDFQDEINVFARSGTHQGDTQSAVSGLVASTVLGSAAVCGTIATVGAVGSVGTAWATLLSAQAANTTMAVGALVKVWAWLTGLGPAAKTGGDVAAASAALTASVASAVATLGASIAATLLIGAITKMGLKAFMTERTPRLIAEMVADMSRKLTEGLDLVRNNMIDNYREAVENAVDAKAKKLSEIRALLEKSDSEERKQMEARVMRMRALMTDGEAIPLNVALSCA